MSNVPINAMACLTLENQKWLIRSPIEKMISYFGELKRLHNSFCDANNNCNSFCDANNNCNSFCDEKQNILVSVMQIVFVTKHCSTSQLSLVVVQSKHSVVEAEQQEGEVQFAFYFVKNNGIPSKLCQKQWNGDELYSRMTQSNISQSGGSKTPLGWHVVRTKGVANQS